MQFHPVAEIFPLMDPEDLGRLGADIKENGLREPIWTFGGKIIDGRNRFKACDLAGVKPKFREYDGDASELVTFVLSLNLHRRHLNSSQRSMVASKAANLPAHRPEISTQICGLTQTEAAKKLDVSERTVQHARKVQENGHPDIVKAVQQGKVTVSDAARVSVLPKADQRAALKTVIEGKASTLTGAVQAKTPYFELDRAATRIRKFIRKMAKHCPAADKPKLAEKIRAFAAELTK